MTDHSPYWVWCAASVVFWLSLIRAVHDYRRQRGPKPVALIVAAIAIAPAHVPFAAYGWVAIGQSALPATVGYLPSTLLVFGMISSLIGVPGALLAAVLPPHEPDARTIWAGKLAALAFMFIGWFAGGAMRW